MDIPYKAHKTSATIDIPLQRYDSTVKESLVAQAMKRKSTVLWMGMAFGVALGLAAAVLAVNGTDAKSLVMGLRLTARWSFLLFWLAYAGGAMAALFGPAFKPLAVRGREFGLAYAAAQLIHLGLVVRLFQISSRPPLSGDLFIFFVVAIVWTYLLAVFSIGGLAKTLGSMGWSTLRFVGLNYILFAFAYDFVPEAVQSVEDHRAGRLIGLVWYAPFAAMSVAAPLLVLAAAAHRRVGIRLSHAGIEPVVNRAPVTSNSGSL
jgi:hypothetical protein